MTSAPPLRVKTLPVVARAQVGRTLPHDTDVEALLLSAAMLDGHPVLTKCIMAGIRPDSFYEIRHQILFELFVSLYSNNQPITIDVVATELRTRKRLDEIGGYAFLAEVSQKCATQAEVVKFIRVVKEHAVLRELIRSRTTTVEDCYGYEGNFDEFLSSIMEREGRVTADGTTEEEETIQKVAEAILADLDKPRKDRAGMSGEVSWGVPDLDKVCGKMSPGNLVILAGQPSAGKSVLSQQAAWCSSCEGRQTLVFTYEMTKMELAFRIAQQQSRLNYEKYDGAPTDLKLRFNAAVRAVKESKTLHVYERDTSVQRIIARTRACNQKAPVGLIVVDFLQYLARMEPTVGKERTDEKMGRITAALKALGKEMGCPVLLLSSLNRSGYGEEGRRPTMASLRNSGEIESDADVVILLHWPTQNPFTGQPQDVHNAEIDTVIVTASQEKGRNKGVHEVHIALTRSATRFDGVSRR